MGIIKLIKETRNEITFTSKAILVQEDKPLFSLSIRLNESSSSPIAANDSVATAAADTSLEEKPTMTSATITPIGTNNSPPIVGVPLFKACLLGPSFLMIDFIFIRRSKGTPIYPEQATRTADVEKGRIK